MLASLLRSLCTLVGVILTALSVVCTVAAGSMVAAMAYLFFTEPRLSERDASLWWWALGCFPVGLFLSWASYRLAHYGRDAGQKARFLRPNPGAHERQQRWAAALGALFGAGIVACLAWGASTGQPTARAEWTAACWAAGYFLLLHAVIGCHEAGHALAARLAGMEPRSIRVGSGPLVWRRVTVRGFLWEWRLWPSWGYAQAVDRHEHPTARRFFVYVAGGPVAGGLCVALALYGFYRFEMHGAAPLDWIQARGIYPPLVIWPLYTLLAMAVLSLWPHAGYRAGQLYYSDGWWLRRAFSLPEATYREIAYGVAFAHGSQLREIGCHAQAQNEENFILERFPERHALLTLLEAQRHHQRQDFSRTEVFFRQALSDSAPLDPTTRVLAFAQYATALAVLHHDLAAARAAAEAVLAQTPLAERAAQLDAFACIPIYHREASALLPDAERWCREALELSPDEITLRGTLATIHFEQGQVEEAVPILQEVLANTRSDDDRGMASFYLALAAGRSGRWREMAKFRAQALRWCRVPAVIGRIHTELRAG